MKGNVLVLTDDRERGAQLCRWVEGAEYRPVLLSGRERFLLDSGEDETIDLVVVDLETDSPEARAVVERLAGSTLLSGVPQLHVFRDAALLREWTDRGIVPPELALPSPPSPSEFASRLCLGAEIGRLRREVSRSTLRDPMTGLFNRKYFLHRLEAEISRARRHRSSVSLVLLDIDGLRRVNDAHGQRAGDAVIRRLADHLRAQVRREDVLARTGEGAFGILLCGNRFRGGAVLANKLRTDVEGMRLPHEDAEEHVRVSLGVSSFPDNRSVVSPDDLVRRAEGALREAKARGGNRVHVDEGALQGTRRTVLFVDEDVSLPAAAGDLLALDEIRVVSVASAEEAIARLREGRPDLLVVDLATVGAERESGFLARVSTLHPGGRFPILALSRDPAADPARLHAIGVDRFLTKPFSVSVLRGMAVELLEGSERAAGSPRV